jgi:hypothetical protein
VSQTCSGDIVMSHLTFSYFVSFCYLPLSFVGCQLQHVFFLLFLLLFITPPFHLKRHLQTQPNIEEARSLGDRQEQRQTEFFWSLSAVSFWIRRFTQGDYLLAQHFYLFSVFFFTFVDLTRRLIYICIFSCIIMFNS